MKVKSLSHIRLLATPWTAAHQAPPSIGFPRQEYCSGVLLSVHNGPFSKLQHASNSWFPVPMIADTSAAPFSRLSQQPSSLYENYPNYN